MTVNIGLVTSDAVVLGCDSVASTTNYFLDPIALPWTKGADGKHLQDANGKFSLSFDFDDYQPLVTNAWGGVTKLFQIHGNPSPVVAVTAGLAKLKDRPIASWAGEFFAQRMKRTKKLVNVQVICEQFLEFMRAKYLDHYKGSSLPEMLKDGPEFIVGGFGRDDEFPSLYRINVQTNKMVCEFGASQTKAAHRTGIAWNGQSDAVERFARGYDSKVKRHIEEKIATDLKAHGTAIATYVTDAINKLMDSLGQTIPTDFKLEIPELKGITLDWRTSAIDCDYANLPIQQAVNFVSFLVLMQAGRARFARGIPTVGGRTHVGVITKDKGFQPLNEPNLAHQYTGFTDDN